MMYQQELLKASLEIVLATIWMNELDCFRYYAETNQENLPFNFSNRAII